MFKSKCKKSLICLVVLLLIISCSSSNKIHYYSRSNQSLEAVINSYENIHILNSSLAGRLIDKLVDLNDYTNFKENKIEGVVTCQPLIDITGDVEAIYISKTGGPILDSLAILSVKNSKFKILKDVNNTRKKYSILIHYIVEQDSIYPPFIGHIYNLESKKDSAFIKENLLEVKPLHSYYFREAEKAFAFGKITVLALVDYDGSVEDCIIYYTDDDALNYLGCRLAKNCQFKSTREKYWVKFPLEFIIKLVHIGY